MNINKCFNRALELHNITAQQLAKQLNITTPYLLAVVSGGSKISVAELDKVANGLGYKLNKFLELAR